MLRNTNFLRIYEYDFEFYISFNNVIMAKKAVLIIGFKEFRDEEYFIPKEILESAGVKVKTASSSLSLAIGNLGGEANVDLALDDINVDDYDVILFVGGQGAVKYLDNERAYKIAREAIEKNKILAAICIAPVILAKAGVLKDKKATVWNSAMDKSAVKILKEFGAVFKKENVVVDGKIITAKGSEFARDFANTIISLLK